MIKYRHPLLDEEMGMKLLEATDLLDRLQGKNGTSLQYQIDWFGKGRINEAIRTVFARRSTTKSELATAVSVQDSVLRITYRI